MCCVVITQNVNHFHARKMHVVGSIPGPCDHVPSVLERGTEPQIALDTLRCFECFVGGKVKKF